MIAGHAALLAWKAGRPVKLVYDRAEDMVATTKRHPAIVRHRTGVSRDGRLLAHGDRGDSRRRRLRHPEPGGAVARGAARDRALPLRPRARARARGDDQHPAQRRLPRLRRAADPVRDRGAHGADRRAAGPGSGAAARARTPCGRATPPPPGRGWAATPAPGRCCARRSGARISRASGGPGRAATAASGCRCSSTAPASPAAARRSWPREAALELTATGVRILVASTEIGQGTRTMHAQIVADTLGLPYERVEVAPADTGLRPRQRAHGRVAHLHGGGQDPPALRRAR